jgi:predicted DCC family thiol-disulfide oxidoreductase YuxK
MNEKDSTAAYAVEVLFDGECPLCMREIALLRRLDKKRRIRFTDIAAPAFDASVYGLTHERVMARIHGRLADGRVVEGVEVFRRLYDAVGFGLLVSFTRLPLVAPLLDAAYRWFAANRLHLTGRCTASCSAHR